MQLIQWPQTKKVTAGVNSCKYIMLHHTASSASEANIVNYLAVNTAQVSCHYIVVWKNVYQIADDTKKTRHAGTGNYAGITDMNSHAIWIEVHSNGTVFDDDSKESTKELVKMLMEKHNIPKENIIRHLDYTSRKWDIWPNFRQNEYKSFKEWQDSLVSVPRQKLIDLWITNGERPKDYATREEVRTMLERLYEKIK